MMAKAYVNRQRGIWSIWLHQEVMQILEWAENYVASLEDTLQEL